VSLREGLPKTPAAGVVEYRLQDPEPPVRPPGFIVPQDGVSSFVPPQSWERQHPSEAAEAVQRAMEEGILRRPPADPPPDEGVDPPEEELPEIEMRDVPPALPPKGPDPFAEAGEESPTSQDLEPTPLPPPQLESRPALPAVEVEDPFETAPTPKPAASPAQKWGKRGRNRLCPTLLTW
jgi:hypothetical protein